MLKIAINYEEQLKKKMYETWFDDFYKYYEFSTYYTEPVIDRDTWAQHQFVSVDHVDNIVGYIAYSVNRQTDSAFGLSAINFTDDKVTFGMDLGRALIDIFEKFKFNKLSFEVVVGNPIEESYDKMVKRYKGRIVGVKKQDVKLIDGNIYDVKMYEILRDDYLRTIKKED